MIGVGDLLGPSATLAAVSLAVFAFSFPRALAIYNEKRAALLRLRSLADEQRPPGVRKLADTQLWRLRVRDFRIVYSINDKESSVIVVRVARRTEDTYKRL